MKLLSSVLLALLGVVAVQGSPLNGVGVDAAPNGSQKPHAMELIRELQTDPHGFTHVADDGIVRSFDSKGNVIAAVRMTNHELMQVASSQTDPEAKKHLEEVWAEVNGHEVPEKDLFSPPNNILPTRLTNPEVQDHLQMVDFQKRNENGGLTPNVNCRAFTCRESAFCLSQGCTSCVQYDKFMGMNCI
ncbi:hypothetical protein PABG_03079 [Paracoccidioides brasiliensis Pb03]|uniref:Uncharacterized protein n=2 Tax=Paracoccidioides brasiliensis TaxID=121759 RepID=C1G3U0_PARBD|nr:uncharacterized protein PADG_01606 [Paracoccidioides brasiliensis Pb18]EEH20848.2 hypothetical protein PABG_03079 [Paracoccidioides brasiliensis Pb03]EEH45456.2 hypothetical protein PADG_01606 [Paracoccidioides brasiliensis Pb18]ODH13803.1 hypothetical protein ACO22_06885 [Paracoccidioides brasiliensis]ODH50252.1 hypothetical protein GX48_03674 [Paracoccidioides brasiliensis]